MSKVIATKHVIYVPKSRPDTIELLLSDGWDYSNDSEVTVNGRKYIFARLVKDKEW